MSENKNKEGLTGVMNAASVANTALDENQKAKPYFELIAKCINDGKDYAKAVEEVANGIGEWAKAWKANALAKQSTRSKILDNLKTIQDENIFIEQQNYYANLWYKEDLIHKIMNCICVIGSIFAAFWGFNKISKRSNGIKLMTMDDLVHKALPNAKLEHHYIEVLRALGEMKQLKKEGSEAYDEELYKLLTQLKGILEALIFKGSYGITVESGAKKLRKLVSDIAGDENFTSGWMKYLDEDERRTLKEQANEIMESIPSAKTKKRNVER